MSESDAEAVAGARPDAAIRSTSAFSWVTGETVAWTAAAVAVPLTVSAFVLDVADGLSWHGFATSDTGFSYLMALTFPALGAAVLRREPGNRLGWLFTLAGVSRVVFVAATVWTRHVYVVHSSSGAGGPVASWLALWTQLVGAALAPLLLLWFPNGAAPGRRWRAAAVLPALAGTATLALAALSWPYRGPQLLPDAPTPDGAAGLVAVLDAAALVIVAGVAVGLASLVRRLRADDAVIRQQVKWYLYSGAATVVLNLLNDTVVPGSGLGMLGLFVSEAGILIAIERFGLWDIDRLINRTLVYGTLTVIAVGAYVGCALGLAVVFTDVGHGGDLAVAGATLAAAALVTPARRVVQSAIDRAFDRRAFDAVALVRSHAERIGAESARPDEPRAVLAQALRDPELRLVFRLSDGRVVDPSGAAADAPLGRPAAGHGRAADARIAEPLTVRGVQIGWLEHRPIPAHETRLFRAVLDAAGPVLAHGRLQAELRVHLAAVQASRTRIVAAADAERRRIERDLHDGAQQRLVALAARLRLEQRRRGQAVDPATSTLLEGTITELRQALEELRALAQGLLPAALASEGLGPALGELVDRQPGEACLVAVPAHRHWSGLEATAWFVAAEGLANAAKHAAGAPVTVRASCRDGLLTVAVADGGPGGARIGAGTGLRGLADRVDALGGRLLVEDRPGGGTDLRAALPCGQVPSAEPGGTDDHEGEGVSPARSAPRAVTG